MGFGAHCGYPSASTARARGGIRKGLGGARDAASHMTMAHDATRPRRPSPGRPWRLLAFLLAVSAALAPIDAAGQATTQAAPGLTILDAVRVTLSDQPAVNLAREQLAIAQGALRAASGRFDLNLGGTADQSRTASPLRVAERGGTSLASVVTNQTRLSVGVDKPLRSGLTLSPYVELTRQDLSVDPLGANRASVGLSVTQPLGAGRGASVVAAEETAARFDVGATLGDLRHSASLSAYNTAAAYWNYVAAYRSLEVIRASEDRARRLVEETQTLIAAGNRPAADIRQVNANLAERSASRASIEQSVFEARQALGLAMGLPADRTMGLPGPADDFPPLSDALPPPGDDQLVSTALASRSDLDAVRQREQGTVVLIGSARDALKPRLDLTLNAGYAGLTEGGPFPGLFRSLQQQLAGPNVTATFRFSKPPANNVALGQVARAEASLRQSRIRIDDLSRSIRSAVAVAEDGLLRSATRVRLLREAAGLYRAAVDDERAKLQLGLATIIDLVLIEDRLTRSLLDEIAATQAYAVALTRLRFETGTLIGGDAPGFAVDRDQLVTVPAGGGR